VNVHPFTLTYVPFVFSVVVFFVRDFSHSCCLVPHVSLSVLCIDVSSVRAQSRECSYRYFSLFISNVSVQMLRLDLNKRATVKRLLDLPVLIFISCLASLRLCSFS
jgi:hypothetical protein